MRSIYSQRLKTKKTKKPSISITALVVLLILSSIISINAKTPHKESVPYIMLEQGNHASFTDTGPTILVFTDQYQFDAYYKTILIGRKPNPIAPDVDFTGNIVIFLTYGEKRTSGYSLEIQKIFTRGNALAIRTILRSPPVDSFQTQVITRPYILLQAAGEGYKRVELVGETGEILDYANL